MNDSLEKSPPEASKFLERPFIQVLLSDLPAAKKIELVALLGISDSTFKRRLANASAFTQREILICRDFLIDYSGDKIDLDILLSPLREKLS